MRYCVTFQRSWVHSTLHCTKRMSSRKFLFLCGWILASFVCVVWSLTNLDSSITFFCIFGLMLLVHQSGPSDCVTSQSVSSRNKIRNIVKNCTKKWDKGVFVLLTRFLYFLFYSLSDRWEKLFLDQTKINKNKHIMTRLTSLLLLEKSVCITYISSIQPCKPNVPNFQMSTTYHSFRLLAIVKKEQIALKLDCNKRNNKSRTQSSKQNTKMETKEKVNWNSPLPITFCCCQWWGQAPASVWNGANNQGKSNNRANRQVNKSNLDKNK